MQYPNFFFLTRFLHFPRNHLQQKTKSLRIIIKVEERSFIICFLTRAKTSKQEQWKPKASESESLLGFFGWIFFFFFFSQGSVEEVEGDTLMKVNMISTSLASLKLKACLQSRSFLQLIFDVLWNSTFGHDTSLILIGASTVLVING